MRFVRPILVLVLFFTAFLNAQQISTTNQNLEVISGSSHIISSTDSESALLNLVVKGAQYDALKNYLPFYLLSKTTSKRESAIPKLVVKSVSQVREPHAGVLKKHYARFLDKDFQLISIASIFKTENLNHHQLIPFRLNALGQLEELTEYEIQWNSVTTNNPLLSKETSSFKTTSILASGNWYKIGITQSGMYKITKAFLISMGLNTNNLDPKRIKIFGNGGAMLPEKNKEFRVDDLEENPVYIDDGGDGVFDASDGVVFYAANTDDWKKTNSPSSLKYRVTKNLYSDTSFYFITLDLGESKKMNQVESLSAAPTAFSNSYDYINYHEQNAINFGKTGRDLYGEYFDITTAYKFSWPEGNFVLNDSIYAETTVAAVNRENSLFSTVGNGLDYTASTRGLNVGVTHEDFASAATKEGSGINSTGSSEIGLTISKLTAKSQGWLDKITVNARRYLVVQNKQFMFRDRRCSSPGLITKFTITNSSGEKLLLFNVSDPFNTYIQKYKVSGDDVWFVANSDSVNEYCVALPSDFKTPNFVGKVPNQNLHSIEQADYLIVTHPLFINEAQRIATFHQQQDGLTYAIATTDQIYNEFASGRQDISAIRDYIRMLYSRNIGSGKEVKYVLLFGDGSYKNNSRSLVNNSNLIPTYQSINSLSETQSIATDDFYGLMDPEEGANAENYGKIDIGIGRFTCKTNSEAKAIVDKVVNYYKQGDVAAETISSENCNTLNESPMGDWRNWLLFLADDEDNALHMSQSNDLAGLMKTIAPSYNADKIFLDAYQRTSTPGGYRYPDASEDFIKRIKKGALIFNYTGHGGEVGLTAERMVDLDLINKLDNFNKLPLFVTATCEFSRYDDPARTSAGELCLINPKGGAIALFTTSRLAYSDPNFNLNYVLLDKLFTRQQNGDMPKLGDVVMKTKAAFKQSYVYANFHLLGDPALTLSYPKFRVHTNAFTKSNLSLKPTPEADPTIHIDTLSALQKVTISGFVSNGDGKKLTSFNGIVYPTVFDKEQNISCLMNSDQSALYNSNDSVLRPFTFKLQKNILYRGKAKVDSGNFKFTFMVPKDISFLPGPGKITYYASDGRNDANGYYTNLVVGGISKNVTIDNEGPQVNLFLNDKNFVNGSVTNENPILYADLSDSSGINTVGTGIGHDISVVLDENAAKPIVLNDYYEAGLNSYQSGRVRYPFNQLSEGEHRMSFKVWDIQNNSNTVYTDFIVAKTAELALEHVLNYPNPFTTHTRFLFQHNQACNPLKVSIQIYSVGGKLVKTLLSNLTCEGFRNDGVEWDGKDDFGDRLGRGVYIYKLAIINAENKKAEKIEKLVILN